MIKVEEKNNTIGKLQHEIANLKERNEKHTEAIATEEKNLERIKRLLNSSKVSLLISF